MKTKKSGIIILTFAIVLIAAIIVFFAANGTSKNNASIPDSNVISKTSPNAVKSIQAVTEDPVQTDAATQKPLEPQPEAAAENLQPKTEITKITKPAVKNPIEPEPRVVTQKAPTQKEQPNIEIKGVKIVKSEITETAKFYPYTIDGTKMELLAVKSSDGSIRTALNTCQICYDSGRGYYIQEGDELVCQNCGNRFKIDKVEIIKGGCNPVPIFSENKTDDGRNIIISEDFLRQNKGLFLNWNKE